MEMRKEGAGIPTSLSFINTHNMRQNDVAKTSAQEVWRAVDVVESHAASRH